LIYKLLGRAKSTMLWLTVESKESHMIIMIIKLLNYFYIVLKWLA